MFKVTVGIKYREGPLAGLPLTHECSFPTRETADRHARWLAKVRDTSDFVRAVGTGNAYSVVGMVNVEGGA